MSARVVVAVAGGLAALVALILLSLPITATDATAIGGSVKCGTGFESNAQLRHDASVGVLASFDGVARCEDAIGTRRGISWSLFGVGLVVALGAVATIPRRRRAASFPTAPGSAPAVLREVQYPQYPNP